MQRIDLCSTCAETIREGYSLKEVKGGVNNRVMCSRCKRRKYGGTYELTPKKKEAGK